MEATIYKIFSKNSQDKCYVGSTTLTNYKHRLACHKCNKKLHERGQYGYCTVNEILELGDVEITVLEKLIVQSKKELLAKETEWIENINGTVNKVKYAVA